MSTNERRINEHTTGDQEVAGLTQLDQQHSFVEIDHKLFSTVILPSADSRRAVVSFWWKNVHNTG